jgi:glucosamine--fructose-6-phosphate aminotransferase (isomerizing)
VAEQPEALRRLAAFYREEGRARLKEWAALARKSERVVFCGMGTSEFVADSALAEVSRRGVDATSIDAGELLHYPRPVRGLLVLISQSGESIETRKVAERLGKRGHLIAITNNERSALARSASLVFPMCAGRETAITTKTYVNTLAVLFLMTQALRGERALREGFRRLERVASTMGKVDRKGIERAASLLADASALHFVARGPALAAAKQAALTFSEGTRISTAAFTGGAFRHGPFEMVDASHRCVFFIAGGATRALLDSMAKEVAEKGSHVVAITDQRISWPRKNSVVLRCPNFGEDLFPLAATTTQELLLDTIAVRCGLRAGEFRHGQKITARE